MYQPDEKDRAFLEAFNPKTQQQPAAAVELKPLSKLDIWLGEVHMLKHSKSPFYYSSDRLGSPNYDNGIIEMCYNKGMSPQEALDWWRLQ